LFDLVGCFFNAILVKPCPVLPGHFSTSHSPFKVENVKLLPLLTSFVHVLLPVGKPTAPPGRAVAVLLAFGGRFQECFFLPRGPGSIIVFLPNEENLAHRLSIAFLE
jgi:hypothetical protein